MNVWLKNLSSKTQILLLLTLFIILTVVVAQSGQFLSGIQTMRYLASVGLFGSGPDACYTQSDISTLESNKVSFQNMSFLNDTQLADLESRIQESADNYKKQVAELDVLKSTVISDEVLAFRQEGINIVQKQLTEAEQMPLGTSGFCSAEGYYDQASCENAGYFDGAYCTGGSAYSDQASCENAGYTYGGGCSNSAYSDQASCVSGESSGYVSTYSYGGYGSGYCSNSSYTDRQSCENAGYYTNGSCSDGNHYDQASCENAVYTYGGYCTGGSEYTDQIYCENAGSYPGYCSGGGQYQDRNSCENAICTSAAASCSDGISTTQEECISNPNNMWSLEMTNSCGYSWTPESQAYGYQWIPGYSVPQNNTWYQGMFVSEYNVWNDSTWYSPFLNSSYWTSSNTWTEPSFQNYVYQWNSGSWIAYGYIWTPADNTSTITQLSEKLDDLKADYQKATEENNVIKEQVRSAEVVLADLLSNLQNLATEKVNLKETETKNQQNIGELSSEISSAFQNQCQDIKISTSETSCSNALDDDSDGQTDCNDSDCSGDSMCSSDTTVSVVTTDVGTISIKMLQVDSTESVSVEVVPVPKTYKLALNLVASSAEEVKRIDKDTVIPRMNLIKEKSDAGDLSDIFSLVDSAKNGISQNKKALSDFGLSIDALQSENNTDIANAALKEPTNAFIIAATAFKNSYTAYDETLLKFLTGETPTSALYDELDARVGGLTAASIEFDASLRKVNSALVQAESQSLTSNLSSISTSPINGGSEISADTQQFSVIFNKKISSLVTGTMTVTDSSGISIGVSSIQLTDARDKVFSYISSPLQYSSSYVVSADLTMVVDGINVRWKKKWAFTTQTHQTIVADITNQTNDTDTNKTSVPEKICNDDIDNNDNGDTDCNDVACVSSPFCKIPVCGDGILDVAKLPGQISEGCDDGNTVNGDGCSAVCQSEIPDNTVSCSDNPGDPSCSKNEVAVKEKLETKSCAICEYTTDEDRFKSQCDQLKGQYDEVIIEPLGNSADFSGLISQCPEQTASVDLYINSHACVSDYKRMYNRVKTTEVFLLNKSIDVFHPLALKNNKTDPSIFINARDLGCHAAGGTYVKGQGIDALYNGLSLNNQSFYGDFTSRLTANQTYGFSNAESDINFVNTGGLTLVGHINGKGTGGDGKIFQRDNTEFKECPVIGSVCLTSALDTKNLQEVIVCGNNSVKMGCYAANPARQAGSFYGGTYQTEVPK